MKRMFFLLSAVLLILLIFTASGMATGVAGYVGSETCLECHEGYGAKLSKTSHWKKAVAGNPINRDGCESYHGPGSEHVEKGGGKVGIFSFTRETPGRTRSSKCLTCHEESRTLAFWTMNRHHVMGVSCNACHSVHSPTARALLVKSEPYLCFDCHKAIRAKPTDSPIIRFVRER